MRDVRANHNGLSERLYARLGPRYFRLHLLGAALSIGGFTSLGLPLAAAHFGEPIRSRPGLLLGSTVFMTLVGLLAEWQVRRELHEVDRWSAGAPDRDAARTWRNAVLDLPRAVVRGGAWVLLGSVGPALVFTDGRSVGVQVVAVVYVWLIVATGALVHLLIWERALRPVVLDAALALPEDFDPPRTGLAISSRILLLVPIVTTFGAMVVSGVTPDEAGTGSRIAAALLAAIGITAIVAMPLALMLRRSINMPLEDLLEAMREVRRGDLDQRLPVLGADEIGAIADHFNEMLRGLQERQVLQTENASLAQDLRRHASELEASRSRVVAAGDEARRRVERDLHDGAQQQLVLMRLQLAALGRGVRDDERLTAQVTQVRATLDEALAELRRLAHGLYPPTLEQDGLVAALLEALERFGGQGVLEHEGLRRYRKDVEAAIYFCVLEGLQNAAKYAGETARVTVRLVEVQDRLDVTVHDDGPGLPEGLVPSGRGLTNMADRFGALGGEFEVTSSPGRGVRLHGSVPVAHLRVVDPLSPPEPVPAAG